MADDTPNPLQDALDAIDREWHDLEDEFKSRLGDIKNRRQAVVDQIESDVNHAPDEPQIDLAASIVSQKMEPNEQDASRGNPHERKLS